MFSISGWRSGQAKCARRSDRFPLRGRHHLRILISGRSRSFPGKLSRTAGEVWVGTPSRRDALLFIVLRSHWYFENVTRIPLRNTSSLNIGVHPTCAVLVQRVLGNVRVLRLLQWFCGGKTCGVNRVGVNQARRAGARGLRKLHFFFPVKGIGARSRFMKWKANSDWIHSLALR
jgi:hypothetical protein